MYQNDWTPFLGEMLQCCREESNVYDPFAIKVTKDGHLPKKKRLNVFTVIRKGGIIY